MALPKEVHKRLSVYTLAAAAAGVGVLAMAAPAEADIISSSVNISLNATVLNTTTSETLTIAGSHALQFNATNLETTNFGFRRITVHGTGGAQFLVGAGVPPKILAKGSLIGPVGSFTAADRIVAGTISLVPFSNLPGLWNNKQGYLGFKFPVGSANDFGWAKMSCGATSCRLTAFAYDTVPGQSIAAGQTSPVPEPSTLSLLALGAAGLAALRKRKRATASLQ